MPVTEEIQRKVLAEATSATPNYDIDYSDQRFTDVEDAKADALTDLEKTYGGMIGQASGFYQDQIDNLEKWEDEQIALKDEQFAFEEQKINQQKEQAHKDYLKEQSASYVDWQKQSNKYGANAEQMASAGLTNTGFAETSQVSMYNTYQMRVASARESFERAKLNYDNLITEARLENNAAKAQIAFETLQKSLELSLAGFQYENELLLDKANKKIELDNMYYTRYQDVLQQINHENAVKEDIRQYNETMDWNKENAQANRDHAEKMAEIEHKYQVERDEATRTFQAAQAVLDRKHDLALVEANTKAAKEKADHEHELALEQLKKEQENKLAQLDKQLANEKALLDYKESLSSYGSVSGGGRTYTTSKSNGSTVHEYSTGTVHGGGGGKFGNANTSKTNTSTSSKPPINYKSLAALGYAGISSSKLADLINRGVLVGYVKNGELHFKFGVMRKSLSAFSLNN